MEPPQCAGEYADEPLALIVTALRNADRDGRRTAGVIRATLDQLYDGRRTGRYRWDQLNKTEKTHFGTLIELNLRREFSDVISDGQLMDFLIAGVEVDCKYSQRDGAWMIPPEARGHLLLVCNADDVAGTWSLGVVRATSEHLRTSANRDGKTTLNPSGKEAICWLSRDAELPPNVLITLPSDTITRIMTPNSGQGRVNELLRLVINRRIGRNTIATVARQDDYMKRVRSNGGARSLLAAEGIIIPSGDYSAHRQVAEAIGAEVPEPGEVVSLRVVRAAEGEPNTVELSGALWRLAKPDEEVTEPAPTLPDTRRRADIAWTESTITLPSRLDE